MTNLLNPKTVEDAKKLIGKTFGVPGSAREVVEIMSLRIGSGGVTGHVQWRRPGGKVRQQTQWLPYFLTWARKAEKEAAKTRNDEGKPQFVLDVQKHLGLECRLVEDTKNAPSPKYEVFSPTGVPMFTIGGCDLGIIGSISMPDMYHIQGVDSEERHERRRAR